MKQTNWSEFAEIEDRGDIQAELARDAVRRLSQFPEAAPGPALVVDSVRALTNVLLAIEARLEAQTFLHTHELAEHRQLLEELVHAVKELDR